jgi:hypothetical protein
MFEQAARLKLRYDTPRGHLSVEDLFDLPLTSARGISLNDIAIALHHQLKRDTISFVDDDERPDTRLQLSFDIVKHVIDVKKAENKALLEARDKAETKQKILGIIARKKDEALEGKSEDELRELLAGL